MSAAPTPGGSDDDRLLGVADDIVERLRLRGESVATAESLTGGLVCAALVDVAGASDVVRGGVVAYAPDLKSSLLGVDPALLARVGTVDADVATQMAAGVRSVTDAAWGLATTGVAGPGPSEGHPAGTVHVCVMGPTTRRHRRLELPGDRADVRSACVRVLLEEFAAALDALTP